MPRRSGDITKQPLFIKLIYYLYLDNRVDPYPIIAYNRRK